MIRVVEEYVNNLANAYCENNGEEKWEKFISVKEGITEEDAENLKKEYPLIPDSLIELLKFADGTYFRDYNGTEINLYFLGSALEEYPYYLLSGKQILETKSEANAREPHRPRTRGLGRGAGSPHVRGLQEQRIEQRRTGGAVHLARQPQGLGLHQENLFHRTSGHP